MKYLKVYDEHTEIAPKELSNYVDDIATSMFFYSIDPDSSNIIEILEQSKSNNYNYLKYRIYNTNMKGSIPIPNHVWKEIVSKANDLKQVIY
jgi:hypothetical protein